MVVNEHRICYQLRWHDSDFFNQLRSGFFFFYVNMICRDVSGISPNKFDIKIDIGEYFSVTHILINKWLLLLYL